MALKAIVIKTSESHDSDDVRWMGKDGYIGFGYSDKEDGRIGLIRCPECSKENYALAVHSGVCCWCTFNANLPQESHNK